MLESLTMDRYSDRQKGDMQRLLEKRLGPDKAKDAMRDLSQGRQPHVDPVTRRLIRKV
jgi:hypothetical protein